MPAERWDVVVAGFGLAGASAAIAAHDAGARVLVAEKTAAGGGNCRHSGGFLFAVEGPRAIDHLDALCFGKTERAVLAAYAAGSNEVADWIAELGGVAPVCDPAAFGGLQPSWPHFPAAGRVTYRRMMRSCATPICRCRSHGAPRRCPVGRTGGRPVGHPGNTGDSIRLAQRAGASLWHMAAYFGWVAFAHPDFPVAFTINVHAPSFVMLDADGLRFADELGWEVHDQMRSWTTFRPAHRNRPCASRFAVFNEAARLAGPLNGIVGTPNDYVWSAENSAELEAGWIARGDSPAELAAAIGLDPAVLEATLSEYAQGGRRRPRRAVQPVP